jgi:hypothetical protein
MVKGEHSYKAVDGCLRYGFMCLEGLRRSTKNHRIAGNTASIYRLKVTAAQTC